MVLVNMIQRGLAIFARSAADSFYRSARAKGLEGQAAPQGLGHCVSGVMLRHDIYAYGGVELPLPRRPRRITWELLGRSYGRVLGRLARQRKLDRVAMPFRPKLNSKQQCLIVRGVRCIAEIDSTSSRLYFRVGVVGGTQG
jgi:hypothetical protein